MKKKGWIALCALAALATSAPLVVDSKPVQAAATYVYSEKSIVLNGQPVMQVMRIVHNGTTYMPVWYLDQVLLKLNIQSQWNGTQWSLTLPSSISPDLSNISLGSGNTEIDLNGTQVASITALAAPDPNNPTVNTSYVPIWYLTSVLQRMGISSSWNGQTWTLTTSPPPSSGGGYQLEQKSIVLNGKPIMNIASLKSNGTTYMPVYYLEQVLKKLAIQSTWNPAAWNMILPSSIRPDLSNIQLGSGTTAISLNGTPVQRVTGIVYEDPSNPQTQTTYVPIYDLQSVLLRIGVQPQWNGQTWTLTSSQTSSDTYDTYDKSGNLLNRYPTESAAESAIANSPGAYVTDPSGRVVYTTSDFAAYPVPNQPATDYVSKAAAENAVSGRMDGFVVNANTGAVVSEPSNVYSIQNGLWVSSAYGYQGTVVPSFAQPGGHYLVMDNANSPFMNRFFYLSQNGHYVGKNVGVFENPFRTVDLRFASPSSVTATTIDDFLNAHGSPLAGLGAAFIQAQNTYGVNATYLVSHAILETGWGWSSIALNKNNLFGYGAYDSSPGPDAGIFPSNEYAILFQAYEVRNNYLTPGSSHYYQSPTLDGMNEHYATSHLWSTEIADLMNEFVDQSGGAISSYTPYKSTNTPPAPASSTEPVYLMNGAVARVVNAVPVYSGPDNGTSSVGSLPAGTTLTVDSMQMGMDGSYVAEWYHVTAGSVSGWIDSAYVQFTNVYRAIASNGYSIPIYASESAGSQPVATIHSGDYVVAPSSKPDASGFYTVQLVHQSAHHSYTGYIRSTDASLSALPS